MSNPAVFSKRVQKLLVKSLNISHRNESSPGTQRFKNAGVMK